MTTDAVAPAPRSINPWLIAVAVVIPTFMEVLDTTIANVALRYMAGGLSAPASDSEWRGGSAEGWGGGSFRKTSAPTLASASLWPSLPAAARGEGWESAALYAIALRSRGRDQARVALICPSCPGRAQKRFRFFVW